MSARAAAVAVADHLAAGGISLQWLTVTVAEIHRVIGAYRMLLHARAVNVACASGERKGASPVDPQPNGAPVRRRRR